MLERIAPLILFIASVAIFFPADRAAAASEDVEQYVGMAWPVFIVTETDPDDGYWVIFRSAGWRSGENSPRPPEEWDDVVHECGGSWYRFWEPGYFDPDNLTEWERKIGALTPSNYVPAVGVTYECDNPDPEGAYHEDFAYVTDIVVPG